jgi:hypothetical protein
LGFRNETKHKSELGQAPRPKANTNILKAPKKSRFKALFGFAVKF